jgi:hypothetical protein
MKTPLQSWTDVPQSVSLEAVVIRADGTREPQGQIAYWHRNPLKRFAWRVRHRNFRSRITTAGKEL